MRTSIVHPGADELKYEIRQIVEIAKKIEALGTPIIWENIGDPIAKGAIVPEWIRDIVKKAADDSKSYGYSPTRGLDPTRAYIAHERNIEGGIQITPDDILFFNGLGDAIATIYGSLHPKARIIGPNPAYPTHSSAEAAHADSPHITYRLDPEKGWEPDLVELEEKVKGNPDIAGILIINPDNPTGFVYSQETTAKIVNIARRYKLFVISDEIYSNLAAPETGMQKLASVIGEVPGIAMRGISKEFPWPGGRCGWIEVYNRGRDPEFDRFARSLVDAKMLEVCATTLPQKCLPEVMKDSRYFPYLAERIKAYAKKSDYAVEVLGKIPGVIIHPARGAFYMTLVFEEGVLKDGMTLPAAAEPFAIIEPALANASLDQRFVYYLLAATGICTVPLSTGFNATWQGLRFTLLEEDEAAYRKTVDTLAESIRAYLASV
jgi:alanine-synthesizing transaminase